MMVWYIEGSDLGWGQDANLHGWDAAAKTYFISFYEPCTFEGWPPDQGLSTSRVEEMSVSLAISPGHDFGTK